jgi:hypothetical protein
MTVTLKHGSMMISASCPKSVPSSPAPVARVRGTANPTQRGISAFGTSPIFGETRRELRGSPTRAGSARARQCAAPGARRIRATPAP